MSYKIALKFAMRTFAAMTLLLTLEIIADRYQPKFSKPSTTAKMPARIVSTELEQLPETLVSK